MHSAFVTWFETIEIECATRTGALCAGAVCTTRVTLWTFTAHHIRAQPGMTEGWFLPIWGCYTLWTPGRRRVTEGLCSSGPGRWNMNPFCFLALFSPKPKKWIELKSGEIVEQAVSGRSQQDCGTFSANHCQAHPNLFSVRNVRPPFKIRATHQMQMTTGWISLSLRIQPWLFGI